MQLRKDGMDVNKAVCVPGENIVMRDINSSLKQSLATPNLSGELSFTQLMKQVSVPEAMRTDCDVLQEEVNEQFGAGNSEDQNPNLPQNLRRRKRKQETVSIHRVNGDVSQNDEIKPERMEDGCETKSLENVKKPIESGVTQKKKNARKPKRSNTVRSDTGAVAVVPSTVATDLHTSAAAVSKSTSKSAKKSSRKSSGNAKTQRVSLASGKALENGCAEIIAASHMISESEVTENQKLRVMVKLLQGRLESIYSSAKKGSKNCQCCKTVKRKVELLSKECFGECGFNIKRDQCNNAKQSSSPMKSSASVKRAITNGKSRHGTIPISKQNVTQHAESDSVQDNHLNLNLLPSEAIVQEVPHQNNPSSVECLEGGSDEECHLCVELTSQTDDDQMDCSAGPENEDSVSKDYPTTGDKGMEGLYDFASLAVANSKDTRATECEQPSVKNECQNSGLTWNSSDIHGSGAATNKNVDGYIDLKCGCTSQKAGDTVGILRLYQTGMLEIYCQCSTCDKGKPMTPSNFERHSGRGASKKWKESIWVVLGENKVPFSKVKGLDAFVRRYYKDSRIKARPVNSTKQAYHRDEFIQCKKCSKKRRFRRKTTEECLLFHKASMDSEWECSKYPFDSSMSCAYEEEREARQANRGCIHSRTCPGCVGCICLGCSMCRFKDCSCQLCVEFIANQEHQ